MRRRNIAVYVRVSTLVQSTELQQQQITEYLKTRGWDEFQIYEDKSTGTNSRRDGLDRLLRDIRRGKVNTVVCWKLDRLFRSLKDLVTTLQEFSERDVDFISIKDNLDMTTSTGRLMTHLLGAFAEFEASLIRERVQAGIDRAKARGKKLGRPPKIDVNKALSLREQGLSLNQIAKQLGCTKSGVSKILSKHGGKKC